MNSWAKQAGPQPLTSVNLPLSPAWTPPRNSGWEQGVEGMAVCGAVILVLLFVGMVVVAQFPTFLHFRPLH